MQNASSDLSARFTLTLARPSPTTVRPHSSVRLEMFAPDYALIGGIVGAILTVVVIVVVVAIFVFRRRARRSDNSHSVNRRANMEFSHCQLTRTTMSMMCVRVKLCTSTMRPIHAYTHDVAFHIADLIPLFRRFQHDDHQSATICLLFACLTSQRCITASVIQHWHGARAVALKPPSGSTLLSAKLTRHAVQSPVGAHSIRCHSVPSARPH